jgi:hypothetical protein
MSHDSYNCFSSSVNVSIFIQIGFFLGVVGCIHKNAIKYPQFASYIKWSVKIFRLSGQNSFYKFKSSVEGLICVQKFVMVLLLCTVWWSITFSLWTLFCASFCSVPIFWALLIPYYNRFHTDINLKFCHLSGTYC